MFGHKAVSTVRPALLQSSTCNLLFAFPTQKVEREARPQVSK